MSIQRNTSRPLVVKLLLALLTTTLATHAAEFRIDIDSRTVPGIPELPAPETEPGWTSLDATAGNGSGVTIHGILFWISSADGTRVRPSDAPALTKDFAFDDGSGQAVILNLGEFPGDFPAGRWTARVWIWDAGILDFETFPMIVAWHDGTTHIVTNTALPHPTDPAVTFEFDSDGISSYFLFVRENNIPNRSRLNAVELTPTSLIVTTTDDNGSGSLRQAIADAAPGATITFAPELNGSTISLTSGQLTLNRDLTIDASALADGITIDADDNSRVLSISSNATVRLEALTITGGQTPDGANGLNGISLPGGPGGPGTSGQPSDNGAGILNHGRLTLNRCTVSGNSTGHGGRGGNGGNGFPDGARGNGGDAGAGGGIFNAGSIDINNSTIANNSTGRGGNAGSGTGRGFGGDGGDGGGVHSSGTIIVRSSTIAGNSTGSQGSGSHPGIAGSGGGVRNTGTLSLSNSIVALNVANLGPDFQGAVTSHGGVNFVGDPLGATGLGTIGIDVLTGDPVLAPLDDYGGPTQTMPPLPGSPAIDAGGFITLTTDQRGALRPIGPLPDIGAVEAFPFSTLPLVDTDGDGIDDRLEVGFFNNLATADGTSDSDGDGSSDKDELSNMTDPTDPTSFFQITSFQSIGQMGITGPLFDVTFTAFPGLTYRVDQDRDVAFPAPRNQPVGAISNYSCTIRLELSPDQDFVRVRRVQPMVFIEPGSFVMGSPDSEVGRDSDEGPETTVTISRGFWMGIYEVTQAEYVDVTGQPNPSFFTGDLNRPVERVSWHDATNFCGMLTFRERGAGRIPLNYAYRLPTEAEWEYTCRAGTSTRFSHGDDPGYTELTDFGWYSGNSGGMTHVVGRKLPNPWGLYDMHGNVWEWCLDWYASAYPGGAVTDPTGATSGSFRVYRGGLWRNFGRLCRAALRGRSDPTYRGNGVGFRVVLAPVQP